MIINSTADMLEATRLTREGRIAEAMALLQGRPPAAAPAPGATDLQSGSAHRKAANSAIVTDLNAPTRESGGAWTSGNPSGGESIDTPVLTHVAVPHVGSVLNGLGRAPTAARRQAFKLPPGARFDDHVHTDSAGTRSYKLYVPSGYSGQPVPLVVMLHGCTQSPEDFARGTRMNDVANEQTFLVVYPAQSAAANTSRCWNWFSPEDQRRGNGEPSLIAGIVDHVMRDMAVDSSRIYVAGLSAGGAAAAIMAATYPDLFAAVGVHSGLACGAASDVASAFAAMSQGRARSGRAIERQPGISIPTIVFHGDADKTVHPANSDQIMGQVGVRGPLMPRTEQGRSADGRAYTRIAQLDAGGREMVEQWILHDAGHAWSGGSADGSYTDTRGPDASREMIRFFRQHARSAKWDV